MPPLPLPQITITPAVPTDIAATGATVGGDVGGALATGADIGAGAAGALSGAGAIAAASGGIGPLAIVDALTGGAFTGDFTTLPLAQTNPAALVNMWPQIQASLADFPSVANRYGNLTQAQVAQQLGIDPAQWQTPAAGATAADALGATGPLAAIGAPGAGGLSDPALSALETSPGALAMGDIGTPAPGVLDPFSNAPEAVPGQAPAGLGTNEFAGQDIFSLAQSPDLGGGTGVGALTGGTGIPTPQPMDIPATISASGAPAAATTTAPAAAATPAAAAPAAGAAGGTSFGSFLKTAGELAPLGALGLVLARGQPSLPPAEQQALNNLGPAQALANQQLSAAAANQITPAQAAQIATYKTNAQNQLYQFYARMGRDPTNDTDYLQGLAKIDSDAIAMQQQFIDSMISNGLQAQGVVDSTLQSAAQLQVQSDQAFQQSISGALQSFGLVTALNTIGSSRTPAPAPAPAAAAPATA